MARCSHGRRVLEKRDSGGPDQMKKRASARKTSLAQLRAHAVIGVAAVGLLASVAAAETGLDVLAGSWRGGGTLSFESGESENISCNGYYKGGSSFSVVIR